MLRGFGVGFLLPPAGARPPFRWPRAARDAEEDGAGAAADALEQLLNSFEDKIFRMAVMMLRDPSRAEEVRQDVFLKIWRALPAYDDRASVSTWVYTIARNTCLSAARSAAYRRTSSLDDTAERAVANHIHGDLSLAQCVAALPEVEREPGSKTWTAAGVSHPQPAGMRWTRYETAAATGAESVLARTLRGRRMDSAWYPCRPVLVAGSRREAVMSRVAIRYCAF